MKKFSKEIFADEDAYYMSCPEFVSTYLAQELSEYEKGIELCSAVGMSVIILAKKLKYVYGIEMLKSRIDDAYRNAKLYDVENVEFIKGSVLDEELLKQFDVDFALLDPDWSVDKNTPKVHSNSLEDTKPNAITLYNLVKKNLTDKIILRVSKNVGSEELRSIDPCRMDNIIYNNEIKFKYAYYGFGENKEYDVKFFEDNTVKMERIDNNE